VSENSREKGHYDRITEVVTKENILGGLQKNLNVKKNYAKEKNGKPEIQGRGVDKGEKPWPEDGSALGKRKRETNAVGNCTKASSRRRGRKRVEDKTAG